MEWISALNSIIIPFFSAIIGGGVSFIGSYFIKKREFLDSYHHKIIDRRLSAYENLEKLLFELDQVCVVDVFGTPHNVHVYLQADIDKNEVFIDILNKIHLSYKHTLWISDDTLTLLARLNLLLRGMHMLAKSKNAKYLLSYIDKYKEDKKRPICVTEGMLELLNFNLNIELRGIGAIFYEELSSLINKFREQIYLDLLSCTNVEAFLSKKGFQSKEK